MPRSRKEQDSVVWKYIFIMFGPFGCYRCINLIALDLQKKEKSSFLPSYSTACAVCLHEFLKHTQAHVKQRQCFHNPQILWLYMFSLI